MAEKRLFPRPERMRRWKNTAVGTKAKKMCLRSRGRMMYGQKLLLCATKNEALQDAS
jgi:hypothetical protein